jgi:hypothetical protein
MEETKYTATLLPEICGHSFYARPLDRQSVVVDLGGSSAGFSSAIRQLTGCTCHVVEATSNNFARIREAPGLHKYHYAIKPPGHHQTIKSEPPQPVFYFSDRRDQGEIGKWRGALKSVTASWVKSAPNGTKIMAAFRSEIKKIRAAK